MSEGQTSDAQLSPKYWSVGLELLLLGEEAEAQQTWMEGILNFSGEAIQACYARECDTQSVDFGRLRFLHAQATEELHRTNYLAADVLLDSYPFNGGTHSLEALWLELPLITLVGTQFMSRLGYSYLKTLGIETGIAHSWEEYVEWGIRYGSDRALRGHVREQLGKAKRPESLSPLWNPKLFAAEMYAMFQTLRTRVKC